MINSSTIVSESTRKEFSEKKPITLLRLPLDVLPIIGSYLSCSKVSLLSATNKYFYFEFGRYIRIDLKDKLSQELQQIINLAKQKFGLNKAISFTLVFKTSLQCFNSIEELHKLTLFKDILVVFAEKDYKMAEKYVACIPQALKEKVIQVVFNHFMDANNYPKAQEVVDLLPIGKQSALLLQIAQKLVELSKPQGARSRFDEALTITYTISDKKLKNEALFSVATWLIYKAHTLDQISAAITIVINSPDEEKTAEQMGDFFLALFFRDCYEQAEELIKKIPKMKLAPATSTSSILASAFYKVKAHNYDPAAFLLLQSIQDPELLLESLSSFLCKTEVEIPSLEIDPIKSLANLSIKALDSFTAFLAIWPTPPGEKIDGLTNATEALKILFKISITLEEKGLDKKAYQLRDKIQSLITAVFHSPRAKQLAASDPKFLANWLRGIANSYYNHPSGPYTLEHITWVLENPFLHNSMNPDILSRIYNTMKNHMVKIPIRHLLEDQNNLKIFLKAATISRFKTDSRAVIKLIEGLAAQNRPEEAVEAQSLCLHPSNFTATTMLIVLRAFMVANKYAKACEFLIESYGHYRDDGMNVELSAMIYRLVIGYLYKTKTLEKAIVLADKIPTSSIQQKALQELCRRERLSRPSPNTLALKHRPHR